MASHVQGGSPRSTISPSSPTAPFAIKPTLSMADILENKNARGGSAVDSVAHSYLSVALHSIPFASVHFANLDHHVAHCQLSLVLNIFDAPVTCILKRGWGRVTE